MKNQDLFITGSVEYIAPVECVETSKGSLKRRQFVVRGTDDRGYEVSAVLTVKNDRAETFDRDFMIGQPVTAWFNIRTFQSRDGRFYNDLSCWRVKSIEIN